MNGMIIVLSGPSGAGKGWIFDEIAKKRNNIRKVLSVTTRQRREEEIGKDTYMYVSKQEFKDMIDKGVFFEWEEYDGNFYGTLNIPTEELSTRDLFFDKDVRGAISIKKKHIQKQLQFMLCLKTKKHLRLGVGTEVQKELKLPREKLCWQRNWIS